MGCFGGSRKYWVGEGGRRWRKGRFWLFFYIFFGKQFLFWKISLDVKVLLKNKSRYFKDRVFKIFCFFFIVLCIFFILNFVFYGVDESCYRRILGIIQRLVSFIQFVFFFRGEFQVSEVVDNLKSLLFSFWVLDFFIFGLLFILFFLSIVFFIFDLSFIDFIELVMFGFFSFILVFNIVFFEQ